MNRIMIEDYLQYGAANATSKGSLCSRTGMCERSVRAAISEARSRGVLIVSSSSAQGYFLAANEGEKELLKREYASRIRTQAAIYKTIRDAVAVPLSAEKQRINGAKSITNR